MSTGSICVPNPCALAGLTGTELGICEASWCGLGPFFGEKCQCVSANSLWSLGFIILTGIPTLTNDIPTIVENNVGSWLFRMAVIITLPYVLTFIVLFIVLIANGTISGITGIVLMTLVILLAIIAVAWMVSDTTDTTSSTLAQIRTQFNQNVANNSQAIGQAVLEALRDPDGLACTGACTTGQPCPSPCSAATIPGPTGPEGPTGDTGPTGPTGAGTGAVALTDAVLMERYRQLGVRTQACQGCAGNRTLATNPQIRTRLR